jgi:DNA-binding transcriptional regulator WhiA
LYKKGESTAYIGDEFGVSPGTINRTLRNNGVEIRDLSESHRKHQFNEDIFETLDQETLYWLGFLITDGGVYEPEHGQRKISLALSEKDGEHVEKFKTFLNAEHPIKTREQDGNKSKQITITSDKIAEDLKSYGVTQRKSFTAEASEEITNSRNFWRGAIDGDGALELRDERGPRLRLHTAEPLTKQFERYITRFCKTEAKARPHKNDIYVFALSGTPAVEAIDHLYIGASTYLDRKKSIANDIIR